jgi:hypothetical protein
MAIKDAMIMAERIATALVKNQIGISAYKTGNLQQSVSVVGEVQGDQYLLILNDPTSYGDFTDFGTKQYRTGERGPFNPSPAKGEGGIVPRYWSTLDDATLERIYMIFESEYEREIEKEFE